MLFETECLSFSNKINNNVLCVFDLVIIWDQYLSIFLNSLKSLNSRYKIKNFKKEATNNTF
jgi:hypothetical protein